MSFGPRLAIILPSRGLPFSKTVDEMVREAQSTGMPWKIYWAHSKKVPDCLNIPTEQALKVKSNTLFWFVDDDMIIPKGVLNAMIAADRHAICVDYPAAINMGATVFDAEGRAFFGGNGCLLVKRETLEDMNTPIWRSDVGWKLYWFNNHVEFEAGAQNPDKVYGQHDVNFGLRLYSHGNPLYVLPNWACGQRRLISFGDPKTNKGEHTIQEWKDFTPNRFYMIKNGTYTLEHPGEESKLVRIILDDDTEAEMPFPIASKLLRLGKAKLLGYAKFINWDIERERVLT